MPDPISARSTADRNLLFGILALQMDFISRDALVAAMHAWVLTKSKPLGQVLREQGALGEEEHALLEALVKKHLAKHGNNPEQSLASVSSLGNVRDNLRQLADPDVEASLAHIPASAPAAVDDFATRAPSLGAATAAGKRFRILRPHARGGLGEVFLARDEELHREVALKEIQDTFADDPESRSRFVVEAEITGGLEHPGIVPVYGLGHYDEGRPFYAMRFVRGDSLKEAIEQYHKADAKPRDPGERTLALRGLLGRFIDVCQAIDYAHSRGVLHRDLKPGNVMLGQYGETLVVDWGLAKPLEKLEGVSLSMEGPLRPASLSGSAARTQAGPVLGTPQYMSPEQAAGRLDQLGPTSDVYSLGATLYCLLVGQSPFSDPDVGTVLHKVQQSQFPPPREVKPTVPRPLEAICLKAMARQPADRYPTPRVLADDVERWLGDEPVKAWQEPWQVKVRRWVGRHRSLVASAVAALLVAAVSLTAGAVMLVRKNEQLSQAFRREESLHRQTEEQRQKAEQNFQLARKAVDDYHTKVSEEVLLHEPGMEPLRKKLLESAREFYQKFVDERKDDAQVKSELGHAYFRLAQITGEIDSEPKAIELHEQARKIFTALADEHPGSTAEMSDLAMCWHHLGRLYRLTDQLAKAETAYEKALTTWEQLVKENPQEDHYQAEQARSRLGLGNLYQLTRRLDKAAELYEEALKARRELQKRHPAIAEYQRDLAVALNNLGMVYAADGKSNKAEELCREAVKLQKGLADGAPHMSQYQNDLARSEFNLGDWSAQDRQMDPAEAAYQTAATLWQRLADKHPAVLDFQTNFAQARLGLANVYRLSGQMPKAEETCNQTLAVQEKLAKEHQEVPSYQGDVARGYYWLGNVQRTAKRAVLAEESYGKALRIQEKLTQDLPGSPQYRSDLARTYNSLGLLHRERGQKELAEAMLKKAVAAWDELLNRQPAEPEFALGLASVCQNLGNLEKDNSRATDALDWYTRAVRAIEAGPGAEQLPVPARLALCNAYRRRAEVQTQLRHFPEAVADWDHALRQATPTNQGWLRVQSALAKARAGEHAGAAAEAAALAPKATAGESLYTLALVYAVSASAAKADPRLADGYAAHGVELLEKARATGYFKTASNLEKLQKDPELDPLRSRQPFTVVLRAAEQTTAAPR